MKKQIPILLLFFAIVCLAGCTDEERAERRSEKETELQSSYDTGYSDGYSEGYATGKADGEADNDYFDDGYDYGYQKVTKQGLILVLRRVQNKVILLGMKMDTMMPAKLLSKALLAYAESKEDAHAKTIYHIPT